VDCVSFAIMREMQIKKAFTFDSHFQEATEDVIDYDRFTFAAGDKTGDGF